MSRDASKTFVAGGVYQLDSGRRRDDRRSGSIKLRVDQARVDQARVDQAMFSTSLVIINIIIIAIIINGRSPPLYLDPRPLIAHRLLLSHRRIVRHPSSIIHPPSTLRPFHRSSNMNPHFLHLPPRDAGGGERRRETGNGDAEFVISVTRCRDVGGENGRTPARNGTAIAECGSALEPRPMVTTTHSEKRLTSPHTNH